MFRSEINYFFGNIITYDKGIHRIHLGFDQWKLILFFLFCQKLIKIIRYKLLIMIKSKNTTLQLDEQGNNHSYSGRTGSSVCTGIAV